MTPQSQSPCDAVMLIGFGGPESSDEIRPFLDRVLKGRPVPRERYEEVVHHYEALGGRSPYNDLTHRQADALCAALRRRGVVIPVVVGFRNAGPFFVDGLGTLATNGSRRALGFILSSLQCDASWERYQREVTEAAVSIGDAVPAIVYAAQWHLHPQFIDAAGDRVRQAIAQLDERERDDVELIFTAHSIPVAMAEQAPYVKQLQESASVVAAAAGCPHWSIAYQSRSGSPREQWLEPDMRDAIVANSAPKVVAPIGFLIDHVEVLYDLDIEAAQVARAAGITMVRAGTVGDHPAFIELMADIVQEHL